MAHGIDQGGMMTCEKRPWPPGRRPKTKSSLAILAISLLVLAPILAQESTGPMAPESPPESTRPEKLYTETEALAAAQEAAKAALDKSVPGAVQPAALPPRTRQRGETAYVRGRNRPPRHAEKPRPLAPRHPRFLHRPVIGHHLLRTGALTQEPSDRHAAPSESSLPDSES